MKKKIECGRLVSSGEIYRISRIRIGTDGPGMSTLVLFKGCRLNCVYCINKNCHKLTDKESDPAPAELYTPMELIRILNKDSIYYSMTGGGVVFGGGEPLLQSDFIEEVCERISEPWKISIETSLYVAWENISKLTKYVDLWIVDIKDINPDIYAKYTNGLGSLAIENLFRLVDVVGCDKVHIRVPRIPGFNTDKDVDNSVEYIRSKLCINPEIFTYNTDINQEMEENHPSFMGEDFTDDKSYQEFMKYVLQSKDDFLAHTLEYIKSDSDEERTSWIKKCYWMLFSEMRIWSMVREYHCTDDDIRRIIDEYIREISDIDEDSMAGFSFKIHIKERIRAEFGNVKHI